MKSRSSKPTDLFAFMPFLSTVRGAESVYLVHLKNLLNPSERREAPEGGERKEKVPAAIYRAGQTLTTQLSTDEAARNGGADTGDNKWCESQRLWVGCRTSRRLGAEVGDFRPASGEKCSTLLSQWPHLWSPSRHSRLGHRRWEDRLEKRTRTKPGQISSRPITLPYTASHACTFISPTHTTHS